MSSEVQEQSADYKLSNLQNVIASADSARGNLIDSLPIWLSAQTAKSAGRGRSADNTLQYGVQKLRELILELAVRGKLVEQDSNDEPASILLEKIAAEKAQLIKDGKIKKQKSSDHISNSDVSNIPNGWVSSSLEEIGYWAIGNGFPKNEQGYEGFAVLFCKVSDMNLPENLREINKTLHTVTNETATRLKLNLHSEGTVIFPKIGGAIATNKRRVIIKPTAIDNNCLGITPSCGISSNYLFLFLSSIDFTEYQAGTSVPALSQGTLGKISVLLPPLAEQQRIVKKVDELMALCDKLEQQQADAVQAHDTLVKVLLDTLTQSDNADEFQQNWRRIAEHFDTLFTTESSIDQLKQTLLQLAVMGKLVPQDPNDEPASALLEKISEEKARLVKEGKIKKQKPLPEITEDEKSFDLPNGWELSRLNNAIDVRDGTHDSPKDSNDADSFPLVTSKNFSDGKIDFESARRISASDHLEISKRSFVEVEDILFSMIGGNIGNQVMVKDERSFSVKNVALFKYYDKQSTSPYFIKKYLENLAFNLQSQASGGAQPFVSLGVLRNLIIALPPIVEQHRIVKKVDELMALCDQLKDRLNQAQTLQQQLADAVVDQSIT